MSKSIDIKPPRLDSHDNGFTLILDKKWFNLSSTYDLAKLNEHNLRLMLKMSENYELKLAEFNKQFIDSYVSDFDLSNESPVGDDKYEEIELEIWEAQRNNK
jgi:hypothetical protein